MIRCIGNVREAADGRYFVSCRGVEGHINPFYAEEVIDDLSVGSLMGNIAGLERRQFVNDWIEKNCAGKAEVYGSSTVAFEDEGDAGLFWFTFTKSHENLVGQQQ